MEATQIMSLYQIEWILLLTSYEESINTLQRINKFAYGELCVILENESPIYTLRSLPLWQLFTVALFTRHSLLRALTPLVTFPYGTCIFPSHFGATCPYFSLKLIYAAFFFKLPSLHSHTFTWCSWL